MSSKNIKAPYECMELKEYKLSDFVPEFSEFRQSDDFSRFGCENIEDNLIRLEKRGKIHFENNNFGMLCCHFGVNIQINLYIVSMIQLAYAKKLFQKNQ